MSRAGYGEAHVPSGHDSRRSVVQYRFLCMETRRRQEAERKVLVAGGADRGEILHGTSPELEKMVV